MGPIEGYDRITVQFVIRDVWKGSPASTDKIIFLPNSLNLATLPKYAKPPHSGLMLVIVKSNEKGELIGDRCLFEELEAGRNYPPTCADEYSRRNRGERAHCALARFLASEEEMGRDRGRN